jgi:hypothetical protein
MKDMLTLEMQSLRTRIQKRLDADPTLSEAYRNAIMKHLDNVISEIIQERESIQRIPL